MVITKTNSRNVAIKASKMVESLLAAVVLSRVKSCQSHLRPYMTKRLWKIRVLCIFLIRMTRWIRLYFSLSELLTPDTYKYVAGMYVVIV